MKREKEISTAIWRYFKLLITTTCVALTIGLLVIDRESVGSVFADVWFAYGILLAFDIGELVKKLFTKQ